MRPCVAALLAVLGIVVCTIITRLLSLGPVVYPGILMICEIPFFLFGVKCGVLRASWGLLGVIALLYVGWIIFASFVRSVEMTGPAIVTIVLAVPMLVLLSVGISAFVARR